MDVAQHHLLEAFRKGTDDVQQVVIHNISARSKIETRLGGDARRLDDGGDVFEPPVPVRLDWNMALEVAGGDVAFDAAELLRIVQEFLDDEFRRRYGSGETYRYGYLAFDLVEMETAAGGEEGARMDIRFAGEAVFDGHPSPGAVYVDRVLSDMFREGEGPKGRFNAKLQWGSDPVLRSVRRSWRVDDAAAMAQNSEAAGWNSDTILTLFCCSCTTLNRGWTGDTATPTTRTRRGSIPSPRGSSCRPRWRSGRGGRPRGAIRTKVPTPWRSRHRACPAASARRA